MAKYRDTDREDGDPAGGRGLQPHVSVEELASFKDTEEARRLARLEADTELMLRLSVEGFEGSAWREVSRAMVEYGYTVMRAWVVTGQVFIKCREKGLSIESAALQIQRSDALEIAEDVVANAIINFRDYVLKKGRWDPAKGASLTTFFIGNCLLRFPNVYRLWLRNLRRMRRLDPLHVDDGHGHPALGVSGGSDPAHEVVERDASDRGVQRILGPLNDRQRAVLQLRAEGWAVDEIAEAMELTYKQAESLLYRARENARGRGVGR